jgi:hypothetical protein
LTSKTLNFSAITKLRPEVRRLDKSWGYLHHGEKKTKSWGLTKALEHFWRQNWIPLEMEHIAGATASVEK